MANVGNIVGNANYLADTFFPALPEEDKLVA
jgi:hypothetical protein